MYIRAVEWNLTKGLLTVCPHYLSNIPRRLFKLYISEREQKNERDTERPNANLRAFYVFHKIRKRLLNSSQSSDIYAAVVWREAPHLDKK